MSTATREYAQAGVDSSKIDRFKRIMAAMGKRTLIFPLERHGIIVSQFAHGAGFRFHGNQPFMIMETQEGLGNKNWIGEWMYQNAGTGRTYYSGIGIDALLMAANDVISHGARPFMYLDEVAVGSDDWFTDEQRSSDLANSFYRACEADGITIPAGESPALRYLIKPELPVQSAPSLSGCVTGFVPTEKDLITGEKVGPGTRIIGVTSSGLHSNGISMVIKRALTLPDEFLTILSNGNTLGEEALIPTRSYIKLTAAIQDADIEVLGYLPGTGDGVSKLASADKRNFTWRIHTWIKNIPLLFHYLHHEIGVSLFDCLTVLNWGIGWYIFAHAEHVDRIITIGTQAGYELLEVGVVEEGTRQTIFGPANDLVLPPNEG